MPQMQLPLFPEGVSLINSNVGFKRTDDTVTYFYGHLPLFSHKVDDTQSFKLIISQMYVNGIAKQAEISRAFGVTPITIKRSVKIYREKGAAGFFEKRRTRGGGVLTPPVLAKIQELFDDGAQVGSVAAELGLKADTIRKAIKAGKLYLPLKKTMIR
jgi:transposase-like protein